jgi:DNA-binding CsgD family transcriptional regulator
MFEAVLAKLMSNASAVADRPDGVAFLRTTKDLYRLAETTYVSTNIPVAGRRTQYAHCFYSDVCIRQFMSNDRLAIDLAAEGGLSNSLDHRASESDLQVASCGLGDEERFMLAFPLRPRCAEAAVFGLTATVEATNWRTQQQAVLREFRILANYFHGHILRINGVNTEQELLISARELDCLKWTAAGKTAWEASVILGISERTVRFHLNMAREKLKCTTTTQAVAKAVANQLIDLG